MVGVMNPAKYGEIFYDFYTNNTRSKLKKYRKTLAKRKSKDKKAVAMAAAAVLEGNACGIVNPKDRSVSTESELFTALPLANVEVHTNASKFAVFSAIRYSVLEAEARYALSQDIEDNMRLSSTIECCLDCNSTCLSGQLAECSCHSKMREGMFDKMKQNESLNSDVESESEHSLEKELGTARVPLIVVAGLRSLYKLIADARHMQPVLCTRALKSLLDVIQGQRPESLKLEPDDLIIPLYELLLEMATLPRGTSSETKNNTNSDASWSEIACSALIGLCIALGDTGKILKAITALLMSPKHLAAQVIPMPALLCSLQRTVLCAALNHPSHSDFLTRGVPRNSLLDEFPLKSSAADNKSSFWPPAMATDGVYLYLLLDSTLLKIGTGYGGTYKGYIYAQNDDFTKEKCGWLGFCGGQLYFRRNSKSSDDHLHSVHIDTLSIKSTAFFNIPPNVDNSQLVIFTDEDSLNAICTNLDDTLVVKQLKCFTSKSHYTNESLPVCELPLGLARKKFRTLGYAAFEDEVLDHNQKQNIQSSYNMFQPKLSNDSDVLDIVCGKEFGLVRASNGKVYYYGKPASLGLKSVGNTPTMKITELLVSKISNIIHVAVGHEGIHALLVNDDGTVYFAGTARRGEDGDSPKNRRQPKSIKPKKMSKMEGYEIVHAACNNGTSAFVTKTGKLIMYGKDTTHCDTMGFVSDFSEQHITKVALGKAHCVVVNTSGQLFTFGLNNKGQCGRVLIKKKEMSVHSNSTTCSSTSCSPSEDVDGVQNVKRKIDFNSLCDYEDHALVQGQCRVCVMCRECTGYNVSCVSTMHVSLKERVSGASCPCGHGDAGCSKCGLCSSCISEQENENDTTKSINEMCRQRSKTLIMRRRDKKYTEDNKSLSSFLATVGTSALDVVEKDPPRVLPLAPQMLTLSTNSPVVQVACGLHHTVVLTSIGDVFTFGSNQYGQLGTEELSPVSGPYMLRLPAGVTIKQVAAGSNHTVLLTEKGIVYTFGSYQKGQLGRLPNEMQQRTDVSNKEAKHHQKTVKTSTGSFSDRYGGTNFSTNNPVSSMHVHDSTTDTNNIIGQKQKCFWYCSLATVFGIGPSYGKRATWISASGDQTFIKVDESLITAKMLSKFNVVANNNIIILIPMIPLSFDILTINRRDGSCSAHHRQQAQFTQSKQNNQTPTVTEPKMVSLPSHTDGAIRDPMTRSMHESRNEMIGREDQRNIRVKEQVECSSTFDNMPQIAFALDSVYNILWVYDGVLKRILCYNVQYSEIDENSKSSNVLNCIFSSEIAIPDKLQAGIQRSQAALNLLACLDILTSARDSIPSCFEKVLIKSHQEIEESVHEDYQTVNRFENFGGGWGYSGHSVEALRFSVDCEVLIFGFGMFGGRGEYTCKLKLYDLGNEGGTFENEGVLVSETKEVRYNCAAKSKHDVKLPKPVKAFVGRWYLVCVRIAGPSSDCGAFGKSTVTTDDEITFTFKSSKKANNGTNVNAGQIPAVLYRQITKISKPSTSEGDLDTVSKVSNEFANSVSRECFESLVILLQWAWNMFKSSLLEQKNGCQLEVRKSICFLSHVIKFCLRILRKYTNEIYPRRIAINNSSDSVPSKLSTSTSKPALSKSSKIYNCNILKGTGSSILRKPNLEEIQLAESIGNVRALLIEIFCDSTVKDIWTDEGFMLAKDILDECHNSFVACFDAFYPTSSLKWNCLCDMLSKMDKGILHTRLLSAILAGLCSPSVKLRTTFSLINSGNERHSVVSPSDNSGLPMLSSTVAHQYPILVEQMIYRTQQEKQDFLSNSWTFRDVLVRLLDILANPVLITIEQIDNRNSHYKYNFYQSSTNKEPHQGLIDNCSHLLSRVLAEVVFETSLAISMKCFYHQEHYIPQDLVLLAMDLSRTWNTGNFGPDAIAFSVDRSGIAIVGAKIYIGSGSYEYRLELLYDNTEELQSQHKWEVLESVSGTYLQEGPPIDMIEIKFKRAVHIIENSRYALRLCSQGGRTCSGDAGMSSIRGPCGTIFNFYSCDLSFNGTTAQRGQIPCILYYSANIKEKQLGTVGDGLKVILLQAL